MNTLIIEDDYDSEFRYSGRPIPALQGLETTCNTEGRVIYVGTFSKILFPGLQIGYVVVPTPLIPLFRQAKWLCDRQCALSEQAALADFIQEGELAKHVRRMRLIYDQRRQALVTALNNIAPTTNAPAEILGDQAGLHIMARLQGHKTRQQKRDRVLIEQARTRGVSLFSAQPHYLCNQASYLSPQTQPTGEFIFGFGAIDEAGIRTAIARIRDILL